MRAPWSRSNDVPARIWQKVEQDDAILLIDRAYDRLRDATLARVEVQRKAAKAALREAAAMARIV
jgi:hypothetical protein